MNARLSQLWRSMPLRLAVLMVGLFSAVSLLSLAASYAVTQSSFEQAIRADLAQDLAGFRAAPNARAVALLVKAESRETDPNRLILSYVSPSGQIYGNGAIARDDEGFHIISLDADRAEYDGAYLTLTEPLFGGLLTIARSRAEIAALGDVFVNILLISLLPTVLIALSGGLILARRSKRHVEVVGRALDDMTSGNLSARVEIGPRWSDDLRQIGGKLNEMAGAQETSVAALKQVSLDIAHDLKTPIQRVSVHLDALAHITKDGSDQAALVDKAQEELDGIASVFQSLLQLAQVEAGSPKARFTPVDLTALCRTIVEVFEPAAVEHGQILQSDLAEESLIVTGDRALLGQMLSNLLENAMRHTPRDTTITVALDRHKGRPRLRVTDTGPGIPLDERDKAVRRLYRLDRSRHTPGNGLGLSLVDAVAKLHGAEFELGENAPGLSAIILF
ncbi:HAMP domain-containing sensor histidine kinase [Sulfitobacter sp. SK011]|uniref:sensor histidine kinase n=1 Tax=Sulfitobacter sp. SK011 TaxID=1389004 RepID=UPI000E0BDE27|nr:ATP-binding protein [Sulfitobacter sp. SK011]AXI41076.1 two-component sensor histidine kinase [Sulfitobacter sp. SK011]